MKEKNFNDEALRLKAIFEHSNDGIITINTAGIIESVNPAAARLFDYTPQELIGQNISKLMPEPHCSAHDQYLERYHQTGEARIIGIGREVPGLRKDGSTFPFFLSISEVQLANEKIYTGFIHDISELKKREHELFESRNQLKAIFDTAVDSIIIIDAKGIMKLINPAVEKLFGYTGDELIGKNVSMLMPQPYASEHDQYLKNYHKTGEGKIIGIGREVEGQRKNGEIFPLKLSVSKIQQLGSPLFTGILYDLTDQKESEREIRQLNEQLEGKVKLRTEELSKTVNRLLELNKKLEVEIKERERVEEALRQSEQEIRVRLEREKELSELKSRFVSMASHEFRTPLSTIQSSAALISRYNTEQQQPNRQKHVDRIKSAVSSLTTILNDFLSLSKLEEGMVSLNPETFTLESLCQEVMDEMEGLLKPGQQLHSNISSDQEIYLDRNLMKNILFNLLSNAIKYSGEGKPINCFGKIKDNKLTISIVDKGIGIPVAEQQHLFSRFFRAGNATNIQGTGLGLHIVKGYIDMLDGQISYQSEEGEGSTFMVEIPLAADPLAPPPNSPG